MPIKSATNQQSATMPSGFWSVLFIQLFSTLSFAVLYSTLVLYMKQRLHLSSETADMITGVYFAYNFALHLLSGSIAGRLFSYRSLICIGLIFQLLGCLALAEPTMQHLYIGLSAMLLGTGTMVTCINMLVSQLFSTKDKRREMGFLWNYAGMNIGFLLGFTLAGYFQLDANYTVLFTVTALTNFLALLILWSQWKNLQDKETLLTQLTQPQKIKRFLIGLVILFILFPTLYILLQHIKLSDILVLSIGIFMVFFILYKAINYERKIRQKLFVFIILLFAGQVFFIVYQLAPMGITLFALDNVNRKLFGFVITPGWLQTVNSITIIAGAPILAFIFRFIRSKDIKFSFPKQFLVGLLFTSVGLLVLPLGIHFANASGLTALIWLVLYYFLLAIAELCITPISYSMIGELAPPKLQSILMGTVLLNTGVAAVLASHLSNYAMGTSHSTNPLITNSNYFHAFSQLGLAALGCALLLLLLIPLLQKWKDS